MTRTHGGTTGTLDSAVGTVRSVLRADDVRLWRAVPGGDQDPPGTTAAVDIAVRGGEAWRLAVVRGEALTSAEEEVLALLAETVRLSLDAAAGADLARRLADVVDATLLHLDSMIGATVEERLVKVARDLAEVIDAKGWSVRILVDDAWRLVAEEHRRGRVADPLAAWAPFDPRALELDEGSMAVRPEDDTQVTEALRHCELTSLVGAIGYDPDAVSWTLCMVGDEVSGDLGPGRTALAALVPAALGYPLPPRSGGLLRSAV